MESFGLTLLGLAVACGVESLGHPLPRANLKPCLLHRPGRRLGHDVRQAAADAIAVEIAGFLGLPTEADAQAEGPRPQLVAG
jgi:hypothetical protein